MLNCNKVNMHRLIQLTKQATAENATLPFAVYSSYKQQNLLNVPVVKPLFIAILSGDKELGAHHAITCHAGDFIFLSDSPTIDMRNIPKDKEYLALLIEFEYQDFSGLKINHFEPVTGGSNYCVGEITATLNTCLQQFVEWTRYAPEALWPLRRKEIIQLLCHMGHEAVLSQVSNNKISQKIHQLISQQQTIMPIEEELTLAYFCDQLAVSESTLRRKLKAEATSLQEIKDQVKLGLGLHLLQTTQHAIRYISEQCGYQSQSRFTERFKARFGITPSELRKTKMTD